MEKQGSIERYVPVRNVRSFAVDAMPPFPHGKVERKARSILDCSVFRAVYLTQLDAISNVEGRERIGIRPSGLLA